MSKCKVCRGPKGSERVVCKICRSEFRDGYEYDKGRIKAAVKALLERCIHVLG